jgi:hypothetical protein
LDSRSQQPAAARASRLHAACGARRQTLLLLLLLMLLLMLLLLLRLLLRLLLLLREGAQTQRMAAPAKASHT